MSAPSPELTRRYFRVEEANARLPLVRAIVKDITELARSLRERHENLADEADAEMERDRDRLEACVEELHQLGAEMKDFFLGLIDFPGWIDDREVCLCWKLGEGDIEFWHETDAGFRGRRKINSEFRLRCTPPRS